MKMLARLIFLPCIIAITGTYSHLIRHIDYKNIILNNKDYITIPVTLADIDVVADTYAPLNQIYSSKEIINLRKNLIFQLKANPRDLAIYWALLKNYANTPDFNGGNGVIALQFAGYIFSINEYIGCLAYEYAYNKRKQPEEAEEWYDRSLNITPPKNMHWEEIKYSNTVHFGIKVMGNFNNWKLQNMYETLSGSYCRKVMVPRCSHCVYKCVVDYKKITNPSKISE